MTDRLHSEKKAGTLITAVMPMRNAVAFLPRCLPALREAAARHGRTQIVIVDNGSEDGSREMASDLAGPEALHLALPSGTISAVRNAGARATDSPLISFVDADCLVDPNYFIEVERAFQDTSVSVTGSMYDIPQQPHWSERAWYRLHRRVQDGPVRSLNGGNLAVRRAVFDRLGGFPEEFITGEDAEFCLRARSAGARIYESHRVRAVHLGNPRSSSAFFRKHVWHGLGMFGTHGGFDKPTSMMVSHAVYLAVALGLLATAGLHGWGTLLTATMLPWVVPIATVAYRLRRSEATPPVLDLVCAVYLCQLYYLARMTAVFYIARRRLVPKRDPRWSKIRA